jgi:hypothetical protein
MGASGSRGDVSKIRIYLEHGACNGFMITRNGILKGGLQTIPKGLDVRFPIESREQRTSSVSGSTSGGISTLRDFTVNSGGPLDISAKETYWLRSSVSFFCRCSAKNAFSSLSEGIFFLASSFSDRCPRGMIGRGGQLSVITRRIDRCHNGKERGAGIQFTGGLDPQSCYSKNEGQGKESIQK